MGRCSQNAYELLKTLRWPNKKESYVRLKLAMDQLAGVRLICVNSWRDNRAKVHHEVTENIGILDEYKFRDSRKRGEQNFREHSSEFRWGSTLFDSFTAGYLKSIDLNIAMKLSPLALRLYRLLDKKFNPPLRTTWSFELKALAYERLGMSRTYHLGEVRRNLNKAIAELIAIGYLEAMLQEVREGQVTFRLGAAFRQKNNKKRTQDRKQKLHKLRPDLRPVSAKHRNSETTKRPLSLSESRVLNKFLKTH